MVKQITCVFLGAVNYLFSSEEIEKLCIFPLWCHFAVEQAEGYHSSFSFKAQKISKQSIDTTFMLSECAKIPYSGTKANWPKPPLPLVFNTLVCQRKRVVRNQPLLCPVWLLNWKTKTVNQLVFSPVGWDFFFFLIIIIVFCSMKTGRELVLVAQIPIKFLSLIQTLHKSQYKLVYFPQFSNTTIKC